MTDIDDDELDAFIKEDFSRPEKEEGLTAAEERIIAGFEDIQRFHAEHGRLPQAATSLKESTPCASMPCDNPPNAAPFWRNTTHSTG